jgi:diguanylate cyclase (GGDEF)-like protein
MFGLQTSMERGAGQAVANGETRDQLTGLPDAALFRRIYSQFAMQALRTGAPLSAALISLDTPWLLARRGGAGLVDHATVAAARRLAATFRTSDVFARWSEDEFVVLFPGTDVGGAVRAVEKAMIAFHAQPLVDPEWQPLDVGFSAAVVPAGSAAPLTEALADAARLLGRSRDGAADRIHWPRGEVAPLARRVLLVTADGDLAHAAEQVFTEPGDSLVRTADLADVVPTVERLLPRMVVLDVADAPETGLSVLSLLRRTSAAAGIPIVVIGASQAQLARSLSLGADDFVLRPVGVGELHARTGRLFRVRARLAQSF